MTEDHNHQNERILHRQPRNQLYRSRGIEVEIHEDEEQVSLALDGVPIEVAHVNGRYYSPTAHMYVEFDTLDEVVDQLINTSDEYWQLHPPPEKDPDGDENGHVHGQHGDTRDGHHHGDKADD